MVSVLAEALAIFAFFGLDWAWLKQGHVFCLQTALSWLGCSVHVERFTLTVEGHPFEISSYCTYVDLIICSFPALWRVRRRLAANLAVLAGFAAAVTVVNLARVLFAVYGMARGLSMFWGHDMVDYLLWYPTLGIVTFLWAQSMKKLWQEVPPPPRSSRGNEALTEQSAIHNPQSAIQSEVIP